MFSITKLPMLLIPSSYIPQVTSGGFYQTSQLCLMESYALNIINFITMAIAKQIKLVIRIVLLKENAMAILSQIALLNLQILQIKMDITKIVMHCALPVLSIQKLNVFALPLFTTLVEDASMTVLQDLKQLLMMDKMNA